MQGRLRRRGQIPQSFGPSVAMYCPVFGHLLQGGLTIVGTAGSPEKKRADPAVLRALCSHVLPSGKLEVLVNEFSSWASVNQDQAMQFDWDDAIGNSSRRAAGLKLEAYRFVSPAILHQGCDSFASAPLCPWCRAMLLGYCCHKLQSTLLAWSCSPTGEPFYPSAVFLSPSLRSVSNFYSRVKT